MQSVLLPMQTFHPPADKPEIISPAPATKPARAAALASALPETLPVVPPGQAQALAPISLFAEVMAGAPHLKN